MQRVQEHKTYKITEIGEIPNQWKIVSLKDICIKITDGVHKTPRYQTQGIPFISVNNMTAGSVDFSSCKYISLEDHKELVKRCLPQRGDILLSKVGTLGVADLVNVDFEFSIFVQIALLKPDINKIIPQYLKYILNSTAVQRAIEKNASGTTLRYIGINKISDLKIPLPNLLEQHKIASILSKVDELIQKTDQVIEQTQRLKKGLTQTLFTKGIGHAVFRKTDIGKIPQEWEIKTIQELSIVVTIGVVNTATPYYTTKEGIPYFRSQNIRKNHINESNLVYVTQEFNQKHQKSILRENDILTVQTGDIGTSCLVPKKYEDCNCHSLLLTRTDPQKLDCNYLCQFLNSDFGKLVISKFALNTGRGHLLLEDFRELKIPRPSIDEQHRITSILYKLDLSFQKQYEEKFKLENLKKGLMQKLLTGKIRVKV